MKDYKVTLEAESRKTFRLQASSQEEAMELASDLLEATDLITFTDDDVERVKVLAAEPEDGMDLTDGLLAARTGKDGPEDASCLCPACRAAHPNMDRLCRSLAGLCLEAGMEEADVMDALSAIYDSSFDPLLYLDFRRVCAFCVDGGPEIFPEYRHERLFGQNACLLDSSVEGGVSAMSTVTQSYELWLLEDMTLAVTFCCEMCVGDGHERETAAYRYPAEGSYAALTGDFEPEDFLEHIADMVYAARHMD